MRCRYIACIFLMVFVTLWFTRHAKVQPLKDNIIPDNTDDDIERLLKRILPFYSNITRDSKLSPLEDAKFNETTGELVAYLRTFDEPFHLTVPKALCLSDSQDNHTFTYWKRRVHPRRLSESLINDVAAGCFVDKDPNAQDSIKLRDSLRLLRNSFEEHNVPFIMVFGSMLGSLRYHQRMFYDIDYDFLVNAWDSERAVRIFAKLSANASTEMRLIDSRSCWGMPKFGLMCGNDPGWRKRYKRCIEKDNSYVVCPTRDTTREAYAPCLFYVDLYWMFKHEKNTLSVLTVKTKFAVEDVFNSDYRPLDGTLFRSIRNFERYSEMVYGLPNDICVPKTGRLVTNLSKLTVYKDLDCSEFALSCIHINKRRPRAYVLTNGRHRIELGLRWLKSGECAANSLFVKLQ
ncbi:unnamed protein product [Dibothriocephalus latus]|uniref:Uncharacterized protein n=1 Tax=Dibothriocephalus latus TaxID=60516 RepID=A0A3P7MCX4_DIBLA|nr:unnamed protein product [Dibothriocephalus latus]